MNHSPASCLVAWACRLLLLLLFWQGGGVHGFCPVKTPPTTLLATTTTTTRCEMCGLVAVISSQDADGKLHLPSITEETERILHRGPDGMEVKSEVHPGGGFALGHTRLAIVDPSHAADQPFELTFSHNKKTYHLAANGEIYNHHDIYDQMVREGWDQARKSQSDCEVIAHAYAMYGTEAVKLLDGMFAFTIIEQDEDGRVASVLAARDSVGIKPLYHGTSSQGTSHVFASELKSLVGLVEPASVKAIPAGHYWTPEAGLTCFYNPDWLRKDDYAPWKDESHQVTDDEIRQAFRKAVQKRMMADVTYGFFLSGGVDSAIVAHELMPLYIEEQKKLYGEENIKPINTYTVGMENSPDVMAAKAVVEALGGSKYINHHIRLFTPDEVFDLIPKIIYHMETYEAELIRSSIPNWLLAERAAQDVKMVLTGEGSDELFAGYLYFQDAETPEQVQEELKRIYGMLGNINLHRTDRMTMAHGLEARVPFLDTEFTKLVMSVDPSRKVVDKEAVLKNERGREKTFLRELFEGPNALGDSLPRPVLWRAKAMQCEGVGEDWVSILQNRIAGLVSDEEMAAAAEQYPRNTPHTKEELYYRKIFDLHFQGMDHVVVPWEGGGRAMGAAWKSDTYTREGLADTNVLSHSLQKKKSLAAQYEEEAVAVAQSVGYSHLEGLVTAGGDDRSIINKETARNKYHIRPVPIADTDIFRGSCTGNPPTTRGYKAAQKLYDEKLANLQGEALDSALRQVFKDQQERIAKLLGLPAGAEVVLCPSGSDAEYIPIAIAKTLRPDAKITNAVTQVKEIGAGSAPAALGRFFSPYAPCVGLVQDAADKVLAGFENISGKTINARAPDGSVVAASDQVNEFIQQAMEKGEFPIVHGVFGGKTGLRDATMPPSMESGTKSLGIVDACQGRFTQDELREWMEQDSLVLFTGSKFYQGPPFCGAVLIPPAIADQLRNAKMTSGMSEMFGIEGLGAFLSDKELPDCLELWKGLLPKEDSCNVGLALRWEAGLAAMEALAPVSDEERTEIVNEWADAVVQMVNAQDTLDVWWLERSIVSIRVANGSGGSSRSRSEEEKNNLPWLKVDELRQLFKWMSLDVSAEVPDATAAEKEALSKITYIGQPVDVSEEHGIVRIALGAESMLTYRNDAAATLAEDSWIVKKMAALGKYFDVLSAVNGAAGGGVAAVGVINGAAAAGGNDYDSSRTEVAVDTNAILQSLKDLLEHLDGPDGGKKLLEASSPSWRQAICQAVGAPDTADPELVARALQQAMSRPNNQFAILMGDGNKDDEEDDFVAVFPTEPVLNDNHAIWVECQLRQRETDKLLVDMGVNLCLDDADGRWKIDELQWQDFRDAYYPGLSGREWLRAF